MGSRTIGSSSDAARLDEELAVALRKALTPDEAAPKQKHVRAAILHTWDARGAGSFWTAVKSFPVLSDEVVVFKTLVTIHKVIRQGHPQVLKAAIQESGWIDQLARSLGPSASRSGYGSIISAYVNYLHSKLQFHKIHPEFSGTFDYEEYISLKGIEDPNEGYETISELFALLDRIETFSKVIFSALRSVGHSEARVSALVPLVEESHGIYQFIVSMMMAMHQIIGSVEVLGPLRDKFKQNHYALLKFYDECQAIKYLTSLIAIPKVPQDPPDFLSNGAPTQQPRKNDNNKKNLEDEMARRLREEEELQRRFIEEQEAFERQQQMEFERQRQQELERQQEYLRQQEMMRQQTLLRQQEQDRLRMQLQAQQEQHMAQSRLLDAQSQLDYFRNQAAQDRNTLEKYSQHVTQLEQQLAQMNLSNSAHAGKDDHIKKLNAEVASWKQKYEALAKLYAQLRKEHLDLLTKFKTMKDAGSKITDEARRETENVRAELKSKNNELTEALIERNRLKSDTDRIRLQYEEEMARLRREIQEGKAALSEISSTKGTEVQNIVSRFTAEQAELEKIIRAKQAESEELRRRVDDLLVTMERNKAATEEEVTVLQAGLDQALQVLAQQQRDNSQGLTTRDDEITKLRNEHRKLLYQMMDNVLQTCVSTVTEAVFELDSTAHEGNQTTSPEYVLSLVEKSQQSCSEFSSSFVRLVNGGDPKDAISASSALAHSVSQLLHHGKGASRLASDDNDAEEAMNFLRQGANATIEFFNQVKSGSLALVPSTSQPERIVEMSRTTQHQVGRVGPIMERFVSTKLKGALQGDLGDAVEREMTNAAKVIDEAAKRMQELIAKHSIGPDLHVHSAILQAAMAITTAISNLIRCATASQQEIVSQGRAGGAATRGAFYKKNNKWTEGLISAAQSVAIATTTLVEYADGLVQGKHTWEQLVVAAQEVGVSTTQLVAAARVKAMPMSKTQDRLEDAAKAVREATVLLVRAAKEASKMSAEQRARDEIGQMSRHDAKVKEMEQQVKILELEKELQTARYRLGQMRKQGYHEDE